MLILRTEVFFHEYRQTMAIRSVRLQGWTYFLFARMTSERKHRS